VTFVDEAVIDHVGASVDLVSTTLQLRVFERTQSAADLPCLQAPCCRCFLTRLNALLNTCCDHLPA
jgi:hypothetical protein